MKIGVGGCAWFVALATAGTAWAQEPEATADVPVDDERTVSEEAPPVEEPAAEAAPPQEDEGWRKPGEGTTSSADGGDGARFRFGISAGGLAMFGGGATFPYGGGDLRFGAQINDLIGVYAQPQLGYYGADGVAVGGGLVGASALADFTFIDRIFVGAGFGYAVLNSPSGPELHFRLGGYPLVSRSAEKIRRKGLMVGLDFRLYFVNGVTFTHPTINLGYEAF